jgi:hypothetical protein
MRNGGKRWKEVGAGREDRRGCSCVLKVYSVAASSCEVDWRRLTLPSSLPSPAALAPTLSSLRSQQVTRPSTLSRINPYILSGHSRDCPRLGCFGSKR